MRTTDLAYASEVLGTTVGDRLEVHAWRGGQLLVPDLPVTGWSLGWDASRQVQGQATITVADEDGTLAPWGLGDALAPGGSRLQVTWVSGLSGTTIPMGWWRIRKVEPTERWRITRNGATPVRVSGGGSVTVQADEETATVVLNRLDAEVVTASTCLAEVARLLEDILPVANLGGVTDAPVPNALVYGDSRMDAVEDLLGVLYATHRMGPDGSLEVVPVTGVGPVWRIDGGDEGALVSLSRALSDGGIYNAAVSKGETATGQPLVGRAYQQAGTLAWGGPFGRVPIFHEAIATTAAGVQSDAETVLATRSNAGEVDLSVRCLTHPGLQVHDRVTLVAATVSGDQPITGRVMAMTLGSAGASGGITPAKAMDLTVRVSTDDLETIAGRVQRG